MGKTKVLFEQKQVSIEDFKPSVSAAIETQGFLNKVFCIAIQESHQLVALIDVYESLQVYSLMTGDRLIMLGSKEEDEEVLSRINPSELKQPVFYNLHFLENTNKVVFVNGYRNEITVYSIKFEIVKSFALAMPNGFALTYSCLVPDEKTILIGNSVGSINVLSLELRKFLKSTLDYSEIFKGLADFIKQVEDSKNNPIFRALVKREDTSGQDFRVVAIDCHPYIRCRILVAYANNLVILYDYAKEKISAVVDVCTAYNELFDSDSPLLTTTNNPCVIKDVKFSIDSYNILVAVDTAKLLIFIHDSKKAPTFSQKADRVIDIIDHAINDVDIFSYWHPKEKGCEIYKKSGECHYNFICKRKLEEIVNIPDKGLDTAMTDQVTLVEHGMPNVVDAGPIVIKKMTTCAFDETGNFDSTLDMSTITDRTSLKVEKANKDEFIEYINTITYIIKDGIPIVKMYNNRMGLDQSKVENKLTSDEFFLKYK